MSSEEVSANTGQVFPGEEFAEARRALGLSFDQLTRELRLPVKALESIESGSFESLGGPVFIRGYIRAYARRLKLDADRYVAMYDQLSGAKDTRSTVRMVGTVSTTPVKQSRSLMRFGTLVFFLAIIGTVVWWWQTQYSINSVIVPERDAPITVDTADGNTLVLPPLHDDTATANEPVVESADAAVADSAEPADMGAEDALPAESGLDEAGTMDSVAAVVDEPESVLEAQVEEQIAGEERAGDMLRLSLSGDSWLSVKDASGRSLFNGTAKAGQELELQGQEPLSVVIGRASAVTMIEYGGVPVDIAGVSNKNVARLTLPASQR